MKNIIIIDVDDVPVTIKLTGHKILILSQCSDYVVVSSEGVVQLRDFLNQLPLTNPLTKEK